MVWNSGFSPFTKRERITPIGGQVVIYGTSWCGMTQMVRRYLERMGVPYKYLDLDLDPNAESQLRWITGGYTNHPTVVVDGQALIEPSINELERVLEVSGYV